MPRISGACSPCRAGGAKPGIAARRCSCSHARARSTPRPCGTSAPRSTSWWRALRPPPPRRCDRSRAPRSCARGDRCIVCSRSSSCSRSPCMQAWPGTSATGGSLIEIKARIFVVLAILFVAPRAFAQLSPGPLSAAHAKLDDDASCNQCHSSGKKVDQPKCLECHAPLGKRLEAGLGLHASFGGQPCEACHVEHVGVKARLIRWPGGAPEKLDHAKAGWPLEGKHAQVACATCHDQKTPSGTVTFLGKKTVCASCHKDPHEGKFGANCQSCHNQIDFKRVNEVAIDHAKTAFPLTGKHQAVACKACHGEPP